MEKSFTGLNHKPVRLMTVVLFVGILALVSLAAPVVKAQGNPKITLNPTADPPGSTVTVTGTGFGPGQPVSMVIQNQLFGYVNATDTKGDFTLSITVGDWSGGLSTVTATDGLGNHAGASFTVMGGSTSSASPTPNSGSSSSGGSSSGGSSSGGSGGSGSGNGFVTFPPTTTSSGGFWSPTVIGVIVAVLIAFAISGVLLYSRSSKQRMMLERERERDRERTPYGPEPSQAPYGPGGQPQGYGHGPQPSTYNPAPSSPAGSSRYTPYSYRQQSTSSYQSRYNQPSSYRTSSYASRYSQPSSYRQPQSSYSRPPMHSKTCSNCKRTVREDQNICPYCNKRT
ncbi:MAG: hypothetical protein ABSF44_14080 [Candidatus Bathyarchaeia archaeon]